MQRRERERFVNVTDDYANMSGLIVKCIQTHFCDSMNCIAIQNRPLWMYCIQPHPTQSLT